MTNMESMCRDMINNIKQKTTVRVGRGKPKDHLNTPMSVMVKLSCVRCITLPPEPCGDHTQDDVRVVESNHVYGSQWRLVA